MGDQWPRKIDEALARASAILPVIGPRWLFLQNAADGRRRIDLEDDWVRREMETSLAANKRLIPVLVSGAEMPHARSLPPSLARLPEQQCFRLNEKADIPRLADHLAESMGFTRLNAPLDYPTPVDRSPALTDAELDAALARLGEWTIDTLDNPRGKDGVSVELVRIFKFRSFEDAVHFMATAARHITAADHHPFWENQYKDLRVRLTTWDVRHRITAKDVRLAEYLERLFRDYLSWEAPADR
jgi:pterin-4a-carbinolamine dehydratase